MPTAPRSTRRRSSADRGTRCASRSLDVADALRRWHPRWSAARRRRATPKSRAKAAAVLKASFKANGQAGLDRLDQDETQQPVHAVCGQAAAEGRRGDDREAEPGDDQVARRRQVVGRLEERREDRAGGPRQAVSPTIPRARSAATAMRAISSRRRKSRTARSGRRCTSSASCAASTTRRASTRTARSGTPRPTPRAPTCRASATAGSSPSSRSRTWSRC